MSVAQPTHLLIFAEASGTSITNYGTAGTAFTIQQGTSPTNYAWHPGAGPFSTGYYEGITNNGATMPYATTTGTISGTLQSRKFACGFQVQSLDNTIASILGRGVSEHGMRVRANSPAGAGDFDLTIQFDSVNFNQTRVLTIAALTFNTNYFLASQLKASTPTVTEIRAKLNSASVVTSGTQDWSGDTLDTEQIQPFLPDSFTNIRGFDGFCYYLAYGVGGADWSDTDFADINSDPVHTLGGWPIASTVGPLFFRRSQQFVNDVIYQG